MSTEHKISAAGRKDEGKGASRRLRHAAQIPAIVYGGHAEPKSVQFAHNPIWLLSQHEWFYSSILSLDIDGKVEKVLLRDMQRHPYRQQIMHLDFQRVSENEAIRVAVPLHFINVEKSPAGKASDVVVTHELNEVHVSCLPKDLPEFIEIDLANLQIGDTIHLSQVAMPSGVEVPELKLGADHDVAVVVARHARVEAEEDATEAAAAAAASAASTAEKEGESEGDEK